MKKKNSRKLGMSSSSDSSDGEFLASSPSREELKAEIAILRAQTLPKPAIECVNSSQLFPQGYDDGKVHMIYLKINC